MSLDNQARLDRLGEHAAALVQPDSLVGIGTGSTAAAMIEALGRRVQEGLHFTAVATSIETQEQASALGIPLIDLNDVDRLDLCIDGADEIDPALNVVKGRGGALLFEKLVARRADHYVIIATSEKLVDQLGTRMPLPVEVVPQGWPHTAEEIASLGITPTLRVQDDDRAFRTDGGHVILDCAWPGENVIDPASLGEALKSITGVVDHGLFIDMVNAALTIDENGEIQEHSAAPNE
jgi:ribose 5-phosphate isomerase A